ncbi:MAG TPA: hypothetical protein VGI23_03125 [Steroidobacteraceae bacterium]
MDNPAGFVIPLVSIVLGILMIIVSIVTKHRRQMQELDNRHRERMAAIEKGLDLPPDTVGDRVVVGERMRGVRRGGSDYLLRGLIWLGVGIALSASDSFFGTGNRMFGWIATAVGVAYLVYYGLEGRREGPPPGSGGPSPS